MKPSRQPKEDRSATDPTETATLRELLIEIHRAAALVSAAAAGAMEQLDEQERRAAQEADG